MKSNTKQVLTILKVIAWIIFIGVCIKTGVVLYSFLVSLFLNPDATANLHMGLNLTDLYNYNIWNYVGVVSLIIFLLALKAYIFYLVIKVFEKINFVQPFSIEVSLLISRIATVAIEIGIITAISNSYIKWLAKKGVAFPNLQDYLGGGMEFLLLGGIIFMIAQVFKRGIEIQNENDLTV